MRIRNLTVSNSRLTEGNYYSFKILKTMELGSDSYFVMQDPLGYKILMPANFYPHYGFEPGQTIQCRVDKINCNGRMFLEPLHPHYREGHIYEFDVLSSGVRINILDEQEYFIKVKDVCRLTWTVKVYSAKYIEENSSKISCRLERIKKGKLFLSLESDKPIHSGLITGKTYSFTIVGERINPGDKLSYFVLKDENGNKHLLKKKYYTHYGLKKGMTLNCSVDKFTSEGFFFLEPENPWYRQGEIYEFKILEIHKLHFSDGNIQDVLVVDDPYNEPVKLFMEPGQVEFLKDKKTVNCKVDRIRKSRLELIII
ncbi:MAG: hypothetical protein K0B37_06480 [Bacteroidales bacterium]|nr:hypothetical protein [Bacteroidales bacterium]